MDKRETTHKPTRPTEGGAMERCLLIVFARYPQLGHVKSRLAAAIGKERALAVYEYLLEKTLDEHVDSIYDLMVYFTPDEAPMKIWAGRWPRVMLRPQRGSTLGERIADALEGQLSTYNKVIIIGSDIPHIEKALIHEAFEALEVHDVVIGPSYDGGYYLIGLTTMHDLFSNISWSTSLVFDQTMKRAESLGLSLFPLDHRRDIDTIEDLRKSSDTNLQHLAGLDTPKGILIEKTEDE